MAHFTGRLEGNKGEATRCGSKKSGIRAAIRSWNNDILAVLSIDSNGKDVLHLTIPKKLATYINGKLVKIK